MENSLELDHDNMNDYQEIIGCLWWDIELGLAYIATDVYLLSINLSLPRRGNLEQWFNIYIYFKNHP